MWFLVFSMKWLHAWFSCISPLLCFKTIFTYKTQFTKTKFIVSNQQWFSQHERMQVWMFKLQISLSSLSIILHFSRPTPNCPCKFITRHTWPGDNLDKKWLQIPDKTWEPHVNGKEKQRQIWKQVRSQEEKSFLWKILSVN